jgi:hypothetical protein
MLQCLFKRAIGHVTRKGLLRVLATVVSVLFIQPAWADAKVEDQKDYETLKKTAAVLQEMLSRDDVAMYELAKADCIIVLPGVKKFSIGIGAREIMLANAVQMPAGAGPTLDFAAKQQGRGA